MTHVFSSCYSLHVVAIINRSASIGKNTVIISPSRPRIIAWIHLKFRQGNPAFAGRGMKAGQGSNQIEYEDEDPAILAKFEAVCAENGVVATNPRLAGSD